VLDPQRADSRPDQRDQQNVARIETGLQQGLADAKDLSQVTEVRVLGAIGVVEMKQPVDMKTLVPRFVEEGIWVRPFGRLVYLMPPYVITDAELNRLTSALVQALRAT